MSLKFLSQLARLLSVRNFTHFSTTRKSLVTSAPDHEGNEVDSLLEKHFIENGSIRVQRYVDAMENIGISLSDPRFRNTQYAIDNIIRHHDGVCSPQTFKEAISDSLPLTIKALQKMLIIPRFFEFSNRIRDIYEEERSNNEGLVANYIPQLAKYSPDLWGVAITTVDGQRLSFGDTTVNFALQSSIKPFMYAVVITDESSDHVNKYIGYEASGLDFNEIVLDEKNKPHNPLINAGAIVVASLIRPHLSLPDRTVHMLDVIKRLTGGDQVGIDLPMFISERENADRNYAIAHYMKDHGCFPEGANFRSACDLYFQFCSIMLNARQGSVVAASLANGGVCPLTGERVFDASAVRNALSIMHSCGMYNYSGAYAFEVGLPSKSGVSGVIMTVIPNVMGLCTWSPPVDKRGNSVRGVEFFRKLVKRFNFHNFDLSHESFVKSSVGDPKYRGFSREHQITSVLFASARGDIRSLRMNAFCGYNFDSSDFDGRTALHLAAASGQIEACHFLLEKCNVQVNCEDRWGHSPLSEARKFSHSKVAELLQLHGAIEKE